MEMKENSVKTVQGLLPLAAKYKYVLLMIAVGAGLMLLPPFGGEKLGAETAGAAQAGYSLQQIQGEMERLLSETEGVGKARVMLTAASGSRYLYQENREISSSGSAEAPEEYSASAETVLLNRSGSGQEALRTQEIYPDYIGALVVCDGAGNPGTVLKVKEAVAALTGLGTDRISVVKRSVS